MFNFFKKDKNQASFLVPCTGKLVKIEDIPDQAFSSKCLGDGFAIELTQGKIVSPVDGEIVSRFPTGHAYGILSDKGEEILVHIGIDTVELNGEGFKSDIVQGQKVKKGDLLCEVDLEILTKNNKSVVSPIIFTGENQFKLNKGYGDVVNVNEANVVELV